MNIIAFFILIFVGVAMEIMKVESFAAYFLYGFCICPIIIFANIKLINGK